MRYGRSIPREGHGYMQDHPSCRPSPCPGFTHRRRQTTEENNVQRKRDRKESKRADGHSRSPVALTSQFPNCQKSILEVDYALKKI